MSMTLTIRNLDSGVGQRLKQRAAANNRSMEAEARVILGEAVGEEDFVSAWLEFASLCAGEPLPIPERSLPRKIDFGWDTDDPS